MFNTLLRKIHFDCPHTWYGDKGLANQDCRTWQAGFYGVALDADLAQRWTNKLVADEKLKVVTTLWWSLMKVHGMCTLMPEKFDAKTSTYFLVPEIRLNVRKQGHNLHTLCHEVAHAIDFKHRYLELVQPNADGHDREFKRVFDRVIDSAIALQSKKNIN